jgi:KDO2-lipid IV(A) lauroyltransferase
MTKNISRVSKSNGIDIRFVIRENLQNHITNVLEFIKYPQFNQKNISKYLSIQGLEYLDKELSKGRGVILATAHFGAKQFLQVGLGLMGYKVNQIHYHMTDDELTFVQKRVSQRYRKKIEDKLPVNFISSTSFLRPALTCLKNNEILVVAADGIGIRKHMIKGYLPVPFLGGKALFPLNIASFARKTGSSILPIFVVREFRSKHKIFIEPRLKVQSEHGEDTITEFAKRLEKYIYKHPHLWEFWEEFEEGTLIAPSDRQ